MDHQERYKVLFRRNDQNSRIQRWCKLKFTETVFSKHFDELVHFYRRWVKRNRGRVPERSCALPFSHSRIHNEQGLETTHSIINHKWGEANEEFLQYRQRSRIFFDHAVVFRLRGQKERGGRRCKISIRKNGAERCYSDRLWALFTSVRMGKKRRAFH